jgi:hypothetical protein
MFPSKAGIQILLLVCAFEKSAAYERIEGQWDKGARNLSVEMHSALIAATA